MEDRYSVESMDSAENGDKSSMCWSDANDALMKRDNDPSSIHKNGPKEDDIHPPMDSTGEIVEQDNDRDEKEAQNPLQVIRSLFYGMYGDRRDPTEDSNRGVTDGWSGSQRDSRDEKPDKIEAHRRTLEGPTGDLRDDKRDKIEAHRMLLEGPTGYLNKKYHLGQRTRDSKMRQLTNKAINEDVTIKKYLGPGTATNKNTVFFFAGALYCNNRYMLELLRENGFFHSNLQSTYLGSLCHNFANRSNELYEHLLRAEKASGPVLKSLVVSCINDIVATTNKILEALEKNWQQRVKAINMTTQRNRTSIAEVKNRAELLSVSIVKDMISKRNQVSNTLYERFERAVRLDKYIVAKAKITTEAGEAASFLADAESVIDSLYAGVQNGTNTCNHRGLFESKGCSITNSSYVTNTNTKNHKNKNKNDNDNDNVNVNDNDNDGNIENALAISDASDIVSTASSFLDFIDIAKLSAMLDDDFGCGVTQDTKMSENHLDAIFERMNVSVPLEEDKKEDLKIQPSKSRWGWSTPKKKNAAEAQSEKSVIEKSQPKLSARERRRQMIKLRSIERYDKQQKKKKEKKARTKELKKDRSNKQMAERKACSSKTCTDDSGAGSSEQRLPLGVLIEI